jgi:hypothetical protein
MTKVIDFQDAKSENNRTKPQGLADYIKKQERLMDLITKIDGFNNYYCV